MSEDPKIIFDSPPAEPFDVQITPDSPPAEPFDVSVLPDVGPAKPFNVATLPDSPPRAPFNVPILPDVGPAKPFQVSTTPDLPPRAPFQVATLPDAPPRAPIDVATTPDSPPRPPFQVAVTPSISVQQIEDLRHQIGQLKNEFTEGGEAIFTVPDLTSQQIEVERRTRSTTQVYGLNQPVEPVLEVRYHDHLVNPPILPDVPPRMIFGTGKDKPTVDEIISMVSDHNRELANFLSVIVDVNPVTITAAGGGALDPTALANWYRDYVSTVGAGGIARFIAEQTVLYAQNPITARVFDPGYFFKMLVPVSMGNFKTTVDTEAGLTMKTDAEARDAILQTAVSSNPVRPGGNGQSDRPDTYGPENTFMQGQEFTVDSLVDSVLGAVGNTSKQFLKNDNGVSRFDASSYFEPRDPNGSQLTKATTKAAASTGAVNVMSSKLAASNALDGVIRVAAKGEDPRDDGAVYSMTSDPSGIVDDDDARVPLSFTDLRQVPGKNFRTIYLRPLNLSFGTSLAPEFSEMSTFGRVDPAVGYQKTTRTVNLSFEMMSFAPEDLELMYKKMMWLESMCYPTYGADSLIKSGPVVRMRIGDVISTESGGVPGVIKSLSFDFADALWELRRGFKVPKSFKVSIDFLVLHDGPVGLVNGQFGVWRLPQTSPDGNTNFAGPDGNADRIGGGFSTFGESVKKF